VIRESPYLDLDFWDNHSRFYSGSFTRYPVYCDRFHFFEGPPGDAEKICVLLREGLSESEIVESGLRTRYLGYCIMRPTPAFVVSRTALEFDVRNGDAIPRVPMLEQEREATPYLKVKYPCSSNVLNARFEIMSAEFIQQDPNLGHCGTAALWVSTKAMAHRFGTNRFPYGTITRQAIGGWNRERDVNVVYDPSNMDSGVSVSEMRNALAETGANSLTFMPHSNEKPEAALARLRHEIYSFIESGIPVMLCLERIGRGDAHVVATVGHALPHRVNVGSCVLACDVVGAKRVSDRSARHYLCSGAIDVYYAHDDSYGPFNRVLMAGAEKGESPTEPPRVKVRLGRRGDEFWLYQVLVPVPKSIRNFASQPLAELPEYFEASEYAAKFPPDCGIFIWRSLCIEGVVFKQSVPARRFSPALRAWYASMHLPKYVWLYEVSFVPAGATWNARVDAGAVGKGRPILGEFLYDATCPSYDVRLLSTRIKGLYWDYRKERPDAYYDEDKNADYYDCFIPQDSDLVVQGT
jgi:hypothetical protein